MNMNFIKNMQFLQNTKYQSQGIKFCFFAEGGPEGLDDLLMGNVSEGSEETSEALLARIAAAQAKLVAVKKDEASIADDFIVGTDRHVSFCTC